MIALIEGLIVAFLALGFAPEDVKTINETNYDHYQERYRIITADEGEGVVIDPKEF